ncbi:Voltage-dependent calcium channel type A subunit alpha-1 [Stylophora pistillata]|uniref:Voltage-dependent L-type calcium channel subunit alpha n=1 Tax=Stylophora pistillata TaxID=50429 RepID=A0A2B4SY65_STYPI|nr:Voltage-dependent calcium channel type A subunit alpha-1 [Stylophora pistillata]
MADEAKDLTKNSENKLRAATEVFQRKYRSMSTYGEQVIDDANRSKKALFCLPEDNPIRFYCKKIVESKKFEYFILLTIAVNCVVLMLDEPLPNGDTTKRNEQLEKSEKYFVIIYCIEAATKIIASGFLLHKDAYLRNGWNILDFVVVVVGLVGMISDPEISGGSDSNSLKESESLKVLRAVRVLRPLKIVSGIPSLQVVMKSIARAMIPLLQILFLILFVIVIYAIVGLELLRGKFQWTCYNITTDGLDTKFITGSRVCSVPGNGGRPCDVGLRCKNNQSVWRGPNKGITTFDNIFLSMLTVFQCITMEGWTDIMYHSYDARDYHTRVITSIIYISLIIIGSFFMLNLVLGVLSGEFAKERERAENRRTFFKYRSREKIERQVTAYTDWIGRAEDIILREERERHGVGGGGPRDPLKKRYSLSDSIMHLIEDHGEMVKYLRNKSENWSESSSTMRKLKKKEKLFRIHVRQMVKSQVFYWSVIVCVFLNTVLMSVEHHGQPDWLERFQAISEYVFLSIFIVEMLLKMYGLGPRVYFKSAFNRFDCAVVLGGIVEIVVQNFTNYSFGISVLRSLRLLRIFKFTRFWASLRNFVTSLLNSMRSILSLIFLLLLFIFIFALLGMQLFGGKFSERLEAPRTNFDNFLKAMLAVFQIMTGEDWNTVMNDGIVASGGPHNIWGILSSLYFVSLVILGNYTLLNVFLAIAVDNLANAQAVTQDEKEEQLQPEAMRKKRMEKRRDGWAKARTIPVLIGLGKINHNKNDNDNDNPFRNMKPVYPPLDHVSPRGARWNKKSALRVKISQDANGYLEANGKFLNGNSREGGNTDREEEGDMADQTVPRKTMLSLRDAGRIIRRRNVHKNVPIIRKSSMFIFGPDNPIRQACHWVVNLRYFDDFILVVILLSSILLAVEDPVNPEARRNKVIRYFDYGITGIFALEVLVKMIDLGVILHKGSYLRSGWNIIDAFVVACNIAALLLDIRGSGEDNLQKDAIKSFRVLRVLRPLKAINKSKKLKGKFWYCNDRSKMTRETCRGSYFKYNLGLNSNIDLEKFKVTQRNWTKHKFHFDNVPNAMLALFSSSTGEGWPQGMHNTIDATKEDHGPIKDYQIQMSLYYVCFVVVFSFFFLNMFVALIIVTFQEQGEKEMDGCELDRNQRDCIQFAMTAKPRQRYMPENKNTCFYKVWKVVDSKPFEILIMATIVLNAIVLMVSYDGESSEYEKVLDYLNYAFTFVFLIEAVLKLIAFRQNYFRDFWNVFDFIIGVTTSVGMILEFTKALPYVVILIGMLFFVYAVIGMQLFGRIDLSENWSRQINHHNNFRSFLMALQVLFRASTGENWHKIMLDCFDDAPCDSDKSKTCGNTVASVIYFCTFYFFCTFLMLNLFVAVIMDNFEYLTRDESILGPHHLDEFVRVWSEYDPGATGRIPHTEVYRLMCDMSPPVGLGRKCPKFIAYKRLIKMNMPIMGDNTVLFTSTLFALIRTALGIFSTGDPAYADNELRRTIKRLWPKTSKRILEKMIPLQSVLSSQQMTIGKIYCAKLIYENYKHMKKKRLEKKKKRRPSLFRRLVGALRNGTSYSDDEEAHIDTPPEHLTIRRRSKTLTSLPSISKEKQEVINSKRRMHRSLKFFSRRPFGRSDSYSEDEDFRGISREVHFKDAPMDLTDINPTIVSTDTEDEDHVDGACPKLKRKPSKLSFKNPVLKVLSSFPWGNESQPNTFHCLANTALEDEMETESFESRSRSSTGLSSPLSLPMVRIEVTSPQPSSVQDPEEETAPQIARERLMVLDFPDVIKSAESSPRHSLIPLSEFYESHRRTLNDRRTREIINQINAEVAQAINKGKSPYFIYGIMDNDEETWC